MTTKMRSDFSFAEIEKKLSTRVLIALVFVMVMMNLFFIQGLRAFIPGVYVAITHVVFGEDTLQNILVLLAFIFFFLPVLTNTISKKIGKTRLMVFSIYLISISRLLLAFNLPSKLETICSGIIVSFYGFFISTFLSSWFEEIDEIEPNHKTIIVIFSIFTSFLIDYFVRTIGFSQDVSLLTPGLIVDWRITQYFYLLIQIPLSISCIYFTRTYFPSFSNENSEEKQEIGEETKKYSTLYSLVFIGIGIFWFLQFNLFLYPNVIAQYTSTNYYINNILNIISIMIVIYIIMTVKLDFLLNTKVMALLNGVMLVSLILFFTLGKILMYIASVLVTISLVIMYLNFSILFILMTRIRFKWEKVKTISNAIAISFVFMVLFDVLHIFTSDWAGTIAAFKGLGPLVMLLGGIIFTISTLLAIKIELKMEVFEG